MKHSLLTLAALLAVSATAAGQGKLDPGSRARVHAMQTPITFVKQGDKVMVKELSRSAEEPMVNAFITLTPGSTSEPIEALGATTRTTRTGIVLASFPVSLLESIEALDCVKSIKTEQPVNLKLDRVRALTGVDKIHKGEDLPMPYTGKGVLCGIVDGGFDPNHVNFLNPDGTTRIKQFTYFRGVQNSTQLAEERISDDVIYEIDSENFDSFHATHTTGIMAGGYRGKLTLCDDTDYYRKELKEVDNPYYGIAPEADIATASAWQGQLSDIYIAYGVESILDWAFEHDQPTAINLSLGSNVGPHDGTSVICQYLDAVIDDPQVNAHVCISAGNEGDMPIALSRTCQQDGEQFGTFLYSMYGNQIQGYQNPRAGLVYIYSDTAEPFEIQGVVLNQKRGVAAVRLPIDSNPDSDLYAKYYVSEQEYAQEESDVVHLGFSRYFKGYFGLNVGLDDLSGRYCAVIDYMAYDNVEGQNANGDYILGFLITGKQGQRIDVYGDGSMCNFSGYNLEAKGYYDGQFDGTINDISCGYNTIIVGSYNSRERWTSLDGQTNWYGANVIPEDEMSAFTSFGTLIDGRVLPDICAPGATVISSSNQYYLDENKLNDDANIQARCSDNKRTYSWHQCIGTSMAAPVVTGTLALWLEAYPQLTCAEAKKIMKETAIVDNAVTSTGNPVQWGAGKLDAYAGLKKVLDLKNAGVDNVLVDVDNRLMIRPVTGGQYEIFLPGATSLDVKVYNLAGACVHASTYKGNEAVADLSALDRGVYVINVNGKYSQKISK